MGPDDSAPWLKTKGYDLARQIEKIRYADLFRKEIDRLLDIRADRDSTKGAIVESLIERGRFAMNPPPDALGYSFGGPQIA